MRLGFASLAAALALLSHAAQAQPVTGETRGFAVERFALSIDREGLLGVEWADVPGHLSFDVSLWLGASDDPLVTYQDGPNGRTRTGDLVGTRVGGSVIGAVAFLDWFQLGFDLPIVVYQERQQSAPAFTGALEQLSAVGIGSPRIVPKLRILKQSEQGIGLSLIPTLILPTSQRDQYFGEEKVVFSPELAISRAFTLLRLGGNFGYKLRNTSSIARLTVENELYGRVGAGFWFEDIEGPPIHVDLTFAAATSGKNPLDDRNQDYMEFIGGASYDFDGPLLAFAGGGLGLNRGFGAPDWRVFLGLRLSQHEHDKDGDKIPDDKDACVDVPEDYDGFEDKDGCPELDNDRDRILDEDDGAPMEPEDHDGYKDTDGIPDPDNDNDKILDVDDDCKNEPGPIENKGCPDGDKDGDKIVDRLDRCPIDAEDFDEFEDDDGCPELDNDQDGVKDKVDDCPLEPGPKENKGCPDKDRDGDTVVDRLDNCPDEPGPPDNQGCAKKQLVRISKEKLVILEKVYFRTGSNRIKRRSYGLLENVAAVIIAHPEIPQIQVEGHTDNVGPERSNQRLSDRRAQAVRDFLVARGVDTERLLTKGFGESLPIATNRSRKGRSQNRRVEFTIVSPEETTTGPSERTIPQE